MIFVALLLNGSFLKSIGLSNIVRKFLPAFVHTAREELNYSNVEQLRSLARRNFRKQRLPRCSPSVSSTKRAKSLREVVRNFQESSDRRKNSTTFLFAPKDPFGAIIIIIFKSSSEFLFWQKIRKFEIGQNVPNLHNFYRAFSAFSQRSYKTTKNYLGFIFS